jgi:hypothetical protein
LWSAHRFLSFGGKILFLDKCLKFFYLTISFILFWTYYYSLFIFYLYKFYSIFYHVTSVFFIIASGIAMNIFGVNIILNFSISRSFAGYRTVLLARCKKPVGAYYPRRYTLSLLLFCRWHFPENLHAENTLLSGV